MSLLCMLSGMSSALPAFVDADMIRRTDCRTAPFTPRHPANPPSLMSCRFLVPSLFTGRIPIHRDALVSHRHGRTVRRSFPFWFILGPHTQSGSTVVGRAHSAACRVVSCLVSSSSSQSLFKYRPLSQPLNLSPTPTLYPDPKLHVCLWPS